MQVPQSIQSTDIFHFINQSIKPVWERDFRHNLGLHQKHIFVLKEKTKLVLTKPSASATRCESPHHAFSALSLCCDSPGLSPPCTSATRIFRQVRSGLLSTVLYSQSARNPVFTQLRVLSFILSAINLPSRLNPYPRNNKRKTTLYLEGSAL